MREQRKALRARLDEHNVTFAWLINILNEQVGVKVDKSEMSGAVNGTISGPKARKIIEISHKVLDLYEEFIRSVRDSVTE